MKLIALLIAVLLVAFLAMKQLDSSPSKKQIEEEISNSENIKAPKVPTSPDGLESFEKDIDKFIQENADNRASELESY